MEMFFGFSSLIRYLKRIPTLQVHNIVTTRNTYSKDEHIKFCLYNQ